MATDAGRRRVACATCEVIVAASGCRRCARPARSAFPSSRRTTVPRGETGRARTEIRDLMGLLRLFIRHDLAELHRSGVKVRVIGERDDLAPVSSLLEEAEADPRQRRAHPRGRVQLRRPTGDRAGRVAHRRRCCGQQAARFGGDGRADRATPRRPHDLPDPDLIIRTSGEQQLSNFLLCTAGSLQLELVFVPIYWPDFDRVALESAITEIPASASAGSAALVAQARSLIGTGREPPHRDPEQHDVADVGPTQQPRGSASAPQYRSC